MLAARAEAEFGGALGVAILGSIGAAVYRGDFASSAPRPLSDPQLTAAQANLASAVDVAAAAPVRVGGYVLAVARHAFVHGLQIGALTAAGLAALLTLLTLISLRGWRAAPVPDPALPPR